MERVGAVVVGAGVVGLCVARRLALAGSEVVLLEAAAQPGTGASSRNSEVLHAGLYDPPGSLKARLCVEGHRALTAYCEARGVAVSHCGKLVVATDEGQLQALRTLRARAEANGVLGLEWLDAGAARRLEPRLRCTAALLSPGTGLVDSHGLLRALRRDAEAAGAALALKSPLVGGRRTAAGLEVDVGGDEPTTLLAERVFNCAGLGAHRVALAFEGLRREAVPPLHLAKGSYFSLSGPAPFSRLVYPVPAPGGLGVHLTLDLAGQARFGPDVEWVDREEYGVDPRRADAFAAEVRKYWPGLPDGALQPAYAGIRPKLSGPGQPARDFLIQREDAHGIPGLVNLLGLESPGLTACLALADEAVR